MMLVVLEMGMCGVGRGRVVQSGRRYAKRYSESVPLQIFCISHNLGGYTNSQSAHFKQTVFCFFTHILSSVSFSDILTTVLDDLTISDNLKTNSGMPTLSRLPVHLGRHLLDCSRYSGVVAL